MNGYKKSSLHLVEKYSLNWRGKFRPRGWSRISWCTVGRVTQRLRISTSLPGTPIPQTIEAALANWLPWKTVSSQQRETPSFFQCLVWRVTEDILVTVTITVAEWRVAVAKSGVVILHCVWPFREKMCCCFRATCLITTFYLARHGCNQKTASKYRS